MFFKKKKKEEQQCNICNSYINKKYSFCPHCGSMIISKEEEQRNFGLLGRHDAGAENLIQQQTSSVRGTFTDRMLNSVMNSLMKNLDRQFRDLEKTDHASFPQGIQIKIGMVPSMPRKKRQSPQRLQPKISEQQLQKMSTLPRATAKTTVKRLGDKVIYELQTPGLVSPDDVLVSKLESGYEIKAISEKKVYVNSLPVNLPIHSFAIEDGKLFVEFHAHD